MGRFESKLDGSEAQSLLTLFASMDLLPVGPALWAMHVLDWIVASVVEDVLLRNK